MSKPDSDILANIQSVMEDKLPMMVRLFLEDAQKYMDGIKEGVTNNDASKVIDPVYTIKSSSYQLGAVEFSEIAKEIDFLSIVRVIYKAARCLCRN